MSEQDMAETGRRSVVGNVATVLLAGLGAALLLEEGVERFVGRLLHDDSSAEGSAPDSPTTHASTQQRSGLTGYVQRSFDTVWRITYLPSQSEIDRLAEQVAILNRKVDRLNEDNR